MDNSDKYIGSKMSEWILNSVPACIYWKNTKGEFLGCNDAQAKFIGAESPEALLGKTAFDTMPRELAEKVFDLDQQILKTGVPATAEEWALTVDNQNVLMFSKKCPLGMKMQILLVLLGYLLTLQIRKNLKKSLR